jgi:hypothetical protein
MEARIYRFVVLTAALGSLGASHRTPNFITSAPTPDMARQIGDSAEKYRRELAVLWLGREMRPWSQPCPITAQVGSNLGAGGATSFLFERGEVHGWRMTIQGSLERILDSVLPHEVTHTIFATHFRQPLPRWADEGACTTVEHNSERSKQQVMLVDFLRTERGIPFSRMFAMREYPHDVMPLYSQGYSVARYLIAQGGRQKFLTYLADGLRDENWGRATQKAYGYSNLAMLQDQWLDWVRRGSPALEDPKRQREAIADNSQRPRPQANLIYRGQNPGVQLASNERQVNADEQQTDGTERRASDSRASQKRPGTVAKPKAYWYPRRQSVYAVGDGERADEKADEEAEEEATEAISRQAIRQQPIEKSRQIILEWSKPAVAAIPAED